MIDINSPAPDFTLPTGDGSELTLSSLHGKTVVLYFYPKDDTPGCTTEARDFTSKAQDFAAAGAVIIGASKDTPAKHKKFTDKHELAITLVSDEDGKLCEAYGTWILKSFMGRKYMGIERATFLIDASGVIRQIWHNVKVKGHADEVLAAVKAL
ncbi:thioredoxin-dependent thiol peroxidase [Govanella unica]|uniref:thioredoxin-dependent peroxiredoxin n=1 Tax=Govanella unica TaxID=2975056 RepID=A0A9X3Z6Z9_9PROT|nr:thioredoxin-dependent thiol peroxidase [Govania unica]MDA5193548.1 thioredoxin-dependent thiol peroxidase [Govania unica]